jgi:hypothetical protein
MPQVSTEDCVPILRRRLDDLGAFVAAHPDGIGSPTGRDGLYERLYAVIKQAFNVGGPLPRRMQASFADLLKGDGR